MMSAGNSIRSLATESYNTAAKKFITRDFNECWELLKPLSNKCLDLVNSHELSHRTRSKLWILYAALVDSADFSIELTWNTLLQGYANLGEVEPSVMLAVSQVLMKEPDNAKASAAAIEEYLSLKSSLEEADRALLAVFASEILPSLGDFEYAKEFTENCSIFDNQTKVQIKSSIEQLENQLREAKDREERKRIELEEQERERVKLAIDSATAANSASSASLSPPQEMDSLSTAVVRPLKPQAQRQPVTPHKALPEMWREWVVKSVRSRGFTNGLLFIIFLLTLASNVRVRRNLAAGGRWVWSGAKEAIKMAVTVTYF